MSANIEQIKAMLEHTGNTNLLQEQKVDLDKERLQLEATVSKEPINEDLEEAESLLPEPYGFLQTDIYGGSESVYSREQMLSMFKARAEWQKQQMEKELDKLNAYLLDPTPKLF